MSGDRAPCKEAKDHNVRQRARQNHRHDPKQQREYSYAFHITFDSTTSFPGSSKCQTGRPIQRGYLVTHARAPHNSAEQPTTIT